MSLTELFCAVDDFCQQVEGEWQARLVSDGTRRRVGAGELCTSEIMTILLHFHQSQYRTFKAYYTQQVQVHLRAEFPHLVSDGRFVQRMPRVLALLAA